MVKTPLEKKLGLKDGTRLKLINEPDYYRDLFTSWPEVQLKRGGHIDVIHFFTKSEDELVKKLPKFREQILQNGIIWVSWPKKASKVVTSVSEDVIRDYALSIGLVDVKVCSLNEIWSGLKLVIPLKLRNN